MQVCLLSVMISKHHATIKRIDEKWTITDENVSILCFILFLYHSSDNVATMVV